MVPKLFYLLIFVYSVPTYGYTAQRFFQEYIAKNLMQQEVRLLTNYLVQIEDVSQFLFSESQLKFVAQAFDSPELCVLSKDQLKQKRSLFAKKRIMIAADWTYYTQKKMPNLIVRQEEPRWDLHHIVFLRLNGQNTWWNIVPLPVKAHHNIVHGKEQPGELLHRHLAARFSEPKDVFLDWDESWLEPSEFWVDDSSL